MRSANSCGWKSSISGSFPLRNAINDCYDINVTEECEIWHHLSPVLLRRHVLWVLGSADRAGRKKKRREKWKLGDDNAVTLLPNSCTYSLLCPRSKFKEGECGSRGRKYSEKLAKIVTLWLTEGAQLPQKRMQTLRAGMNLHCSQAGIVRTMQKSPSPSWSLNTSCAERLGHPRTQSSDSEELQERTDFCDRM